MNTKYPQKFHTIFGGIFCIIKNIKKILNGSKMKDMSVNTQRSFFNFCEEFSNQILMF